MTKKEPEIRTPENRVDSPIVEPQTVNVEMSEFQAALLREYQTLRHTLKTGKNRVKAIRKLLVAEGIPDNIIGD